MSLLQKDVLDEFLRSEMFREWRSDFREHLAFNGVPPERAGKIISLSERAFRAAAGAIRRIAATSGNHSTSKAVELDALNLLGAVARGANASIIAAIEPETLQ